MLHGFIKKMPQFSKILEMSFLKWESFHDENILKVPYLYNRNLT